MQQWAETELKYLNFGNSFLLISCIDCVEYQVVSYYFRCLHNQSGYFIFFFEKILYL